MAPIRILVADDHPLFREGVARSLAEDPGIEVVAEAASADEAVTAARNTLPDLALLDISMPGGGHAALSAIRAMQTPPVVAMLTVSEDDEDVLLALKGGALGYVLKGIGGRDLVAVVKDLAAGRSYLSPSLAMKVMAAMNAPKERRDENPLDTLTKREEDILRQVAQGRSNKEIGRDLGIQEKTVKHYMTAILQKLEVRNRTEAALMARDHWQA